MADDASPSAPARPSLRHANSSSGRATPDGATAAATTGTSSGISAPPGHAFRRAKTMAETNPGARQSTSGGGRRFSSDSSFDACPPAPRRSSNFSDYSINEARSILNPQRKATASPDGGDSSPESSSLAGLSLAFALLPALAGALFKNGGAVTTDIMLLGLAGVFLHWSVTQPW